jgi:hypothetical protein
VLAVGVLAVMVAVDEWAVSGRSDANAIFDVGKSLLIPIVGGAGIWGCTRGCRSAMYLTGAKTPPLRDGQPKRCRPE